jgi:hypothetical protein
MLSSAHLGLGPRGKIFKPGDGSRWMWVRTLMNYYVDIYSRVGAEYSVDGRKCPELA